jgi:hypothetical protein
MYDRELSKFSNISARTPLPVLLDRMREYSWIVQTLVEGVKIETATLEELTRAHGAPEHWVAELSRIKSEMECIEAMHRLKKLGFDVVENLIRQYRRGGPVFALGDLILSIYGRHIVWCDTSMRRLEDLRERVVALAEHTASQQLPDSNL